MKTSEQVETGRTGGFRTSPLMMLCETKRLKTIKIFIQESDRKQMREARRDPELIKYMEEKTAGQPCNSMFRNLRTLQGLEYLVTLRGIEQVEFFDLDKWIRHGIVISVHDYTFVRDIASTVCREKNAKDGFFSQIQNLMPLADGIMPDRQTCKLLNTICRSPSQGDAAPDFETVDVVPISSRAVNTDIPGWPTVGRSDRAGYH